jgi:acyl dehydratase
MKKPIQQLYFEDFKPGMVFEFGDYLMSEEEIIRFATAYDPQPYHVSRNPGPGKASAELIASGWHTGSATMRMMVDNFFPQDTVLPAAGIETLRFPNPVRPGDRLHVKLTIGELRPSRSKRDRGIVSIHVETFDQNNELKMSSVNVVLFRRKT